MAESRAMELVQLEFKAYDSLHIACAEMGNAEMLTTDDRLIRKAAMHSSVLQVRVQNPVLWLLEVKTNGNS
jgi:predicted nucleic acid-binding protein